MKKFLEVYKEEYLRLCQEKVSRINLDSRIFEELSNLNVCTDKMGKNGYIEKDGGNGPCKVSEENEKICKKDANGNILKDKDGKDDCISGGSNLNSGKRFSCERDLGLNISDIIKNKLNNLKDQKWKLVAKNETSGELARGIYKIHVAGAQGGRGGDSCSCAGRIGDGGSGGGGQVSTDIAVIKNTAKYTATLGLEGSRGSDDKPYIGSADGDNGGTGGNSEFKIPDVLTITALGGGGGKGGTSRGCHRYDDGDSGYSRGPNSGNGKIKIEQLELPEAPVSDQNASASGQKENNKGNNSTNQN